jgi:hypothetical protein
MNLIIDSSLCEPPSEVSCFRDVTLYSKVFIFEDILVQCEEGTRSLYWKWLKRHGAHDFISQLIRTREKEPGFTIRTSKGNLTIDRITAFNLSHILSTLSALKKS